MTTEVSLVAQFLVRWLVPVCVCVSVRYISTWGSLWFLGVVVCVYTYMGEREVL